MRGGALAGAAGSALRRLALLALAAGHGRAAPEGHLRRAEAQFLFDSAIETLLVDYEASRIADEVVLKLEAGGCVGLSTRGPYAFRVRFIMGEPGTAPPIHSPMVEPDGTDAPFRHFSGNGEGITAAFGAITLSPSGTLVLWKGAVGGAVLAETERLNLSAGSVAFQSIKASSSADGAAPPQAKVYGGGASPKDADRLRRQRSDAAVYNTATYAPQYYHSNGYAALGVVNATGGYKLPVSWAVHGETVRWSFSNASASFELYMMPAKTLAEGTLRLYELVGAPAVPPRYALGFFASRWGWKGKTYAQAIVSEFRKDGFPLDSIIFDFEWFVNGTDYGFDPPGKSWYDDFGYHSKLFPGTYTNTTGSTSCTSCSTGKVNPDLYATQSQVLVSGTSEWIPTTGAESAAACGCKVGAYEKEGECELCGEGMECPGMGEVIIAPDYFASADQPGFVWRCYGTDYRRCPGGPPGTCAESRLTSSVACTVCDDGMVPSDQGECKECSGIHVLPILLILVVAGGAMMVLYRILGSSDPASRSKSFLLVATVAGQLFTFVQQLGIMGAISLEWKSPFAEFLVTISLFNFNLDYLSLECATSVDPVSKFTGRVFLVIAFVLSMLVIHSIAVIVHHGGAFRERNPALICSIGTVFSTFFMSIMASMLAPFQCAKHPNGLQTVRDYPSVVCYDSAYGDGHAIMLGVSATGALIPLAFFASVVYVVLQMEKRLAAGDERFLRSFLFLFFRFRTGAHTYIAIFLFRNLIIAVVPALGSTMFQIMILQVIMIPLLVVTVYFMPWNAFLANLIDGSSTMLLSLIVTLFAFYCEDVDAEIVAQLCTAICCIAFIIIFCAIAWGMLAQILRMEKPMQFFLCHHKDGAGNFTRLLKMSLDTKSKKEIGVDSDYIDPSALFATVASDVDMLVTVCSRQIVSQLFCVGEMTTAKLNKVPVCNVLLPDFAYPSEDFVNKYDIEMPRVTHLARYGLNLETVKASLPNPGQESVKLPSHITSGTIQSLVGMLTREHAAVSLQDDKGTIDPSGSSSFFIVADMGALECACAALVLQLLLARAVQGKAAEVPQLLPLGAALPSSAEKVCLVLSNGVFASPHVATALRRAADANAAVLPVVAEPSFRFPTKGSLQQLAEGAPGAPGECTGAELARLVARTCEGAVVEASPQAPEADLLVRAQAVLAWLSEARLLAVEPRPDAWVQLGDQPGPGGPDEGPEDGQAGAEQDGAGAEASPHVAV